MKVIYLGPEETVAVVRANLPESFEIVHATEGEQVDKHIAGADIIFDAYMKVSFPAERLRKANQLKLVITATTGADHIDSKVLAERNIPLLTLKDQQEFLKNITSAAEHSWLLLMSCARQLRAAIAHTGKGGWDRNLFPGVLLRGKTIGIIGCGRIGGWMANYAQAFGMNILGFDPFLTDFPKNIRKVELDTLVAGSDFISVHVPLSDETALLLSRDKFEIMKPGAILINTSRGNIIDENALLEGLKSGRIKAAGLDVLTGEPELADSPLMNYAKANHNLIITPHIGGYCPDALHVVLEFSCQRIKNYFKTEPEYAG